MPSWPFRNKAIFKKGPHLKFLLTKPSMVCSFDELNYNVLHNRILKTTIKRLVNCVDLDHSIKKGLIILSRKLEGVCLIPLMKRHFGLVQLNSNNYFYDFLLKICELIYDCLLVSEEDGKSKFKEFIRDEKVMASLFEEFIRNFYKREQSEFHVGRENIPWQTMNEDDEAKKYLPRMQTDVSLTSETRKIIIDAKYYRQALQSYYDKKTIHSENLYQLYAYVTNVKPDSAFLGKCEGILVYPTVKDIIDLRYDFKGFKISIKTINLNQEWKAIHRDLLNIINVNYV